MTYPVRIVDSTGLRAWCDAPPGELVDEYCYRKAAETGETLFCWSPSPGRSFSWICPGCGRLAGGMLGDEPVSGWEAPRWVNSGTQERPTLTPSLGCPGLPSGRCTGHWWLRDGELVPA